MFTKRLFTFVTCFIYSRWAHSYLEHHGACEDTCAAQIGPLYLEINRCFVLDHDDASIGVRIPTLHRNNGRWHWGRLYLGYQFCQGDEQVRQPGVAVTWTRPLSQGVYSQAHPPVDDEYFPF